MTLFICCDVCGARVDPAQSISTSQSLAARQCQEKLRYSILYIKLLHIDNSVSDILDQRRHSFPTAILTVHKTPLSLHSVSFQVLYHSRKKVCVSDYTVDQWPMLSKPQRGTASGATAFWSTTVSWSGITDVRDTLPLVICSCSTTFSFTDSCASPPASTATAQPAWRHKLLPVGCMQLKPNPSSPCMLKLFRYGSFPYPTQYMLACPPDPSLTCCIRVHVQRVAPRTSGGRAAVVTHSGAVTTCRASMASDVSVAVRPLPSDCRTCELCL